MSILTGAFSRSTTREQAMGPVVPGRYFDALAFVDETTRARPIPNIPANE
jgi:erythromycin esterase-like protein